MGIGGRTTECLALNPTMCDRNVGAFLMLYQSVVQTAPSKLLVMSHVTDADSVKHDVTGVSAIRVVYEGSVEAYAVLETLDRAFVWIDISSSSVTIQTRGGSSGNLKNCEFHQNWLHAISASNHIVVLKDCLSQAIHLHRLDSSIEQLWKYTPADNMHEVIEPGLVM